jgi:predicted nucleotidyltransferase
MKTIDIRPEDLRLVRSILDRHLPGREIRVFGSRVGGKTKPFSDLDLAVMGEEPIAASVMADVREAFRESDLPFKVDVVEWAVTRDPFRRIIEREFVTVRGEGVTA